jgi:hypothetical protein
MLSWLYRAISFVDRACWATIVPIDVAGWFHLQLYKEKGTEIGQKKSFQKK